MCSINVINVAVDRTASPPGGYSQYIPAKDSGIGFHRLGPPLLPPHLLDTILNKDVPRHVCISHHIRHWLFFLIALCVELSN